MQALRRTYGRRREASPAEDQVMKDDTTPTPQHSPNVLTPKSKVAAMLARLDESAGESDETDSPHKKTSERNRTGTARHKDRAQLRELSTSPIRPRAKQDKSPKAGQSMLNVYDNSDNKVMRDMHAEIASASNDSPQASGYGSDSEDSLKSIRDAHKSRRLPSVSQIMRDLSEDSDSDTDSNTKKHEGHEIEDTYTRMRKALLSKPFSTSTKSAARDDPASEQDSDIELPGTGLVLQQAIDALSVRSKVEELALKRRQVQSPDQPAIEKAALDKGKGSTSDSDSEDIEAEIRMSSARRIPRRAANKKAIEAMHKETERLRRNMTLAPDTSVKTRLHVNDFLSKIGYLRQPESTTRATEIQTTQHNSSTPMLDDPFTEHDASLHAPVSPAAPAPVLPLSKSIAPELEESDSDIELPSMADLVSSQTAVPALPAEALQFKPIISIHEDVLLESGSDSASDADVPGYLKNHKLLFRKRDFEQIKKDRRAAKFVAMARPDSPTKQEARAEKARRAALIAQVSNQAKAERKVREAAMLAAGVTIVSAEQRQREALEVEDLVEKARRQAMELRKLEEKEDRKRRAAEDGVNDIDGDSDDGSEDHEWQGDEEEGASNASDTDHDASDLEEGDQSNIEQNASAKPSLRRHSSILSERRLSDDEDGHMSPIRRRAPTKNNRALRVVDDDSEEDKENFMPSPGVARAEIGLTQFFEATPAVAVQHQSNDFSASQFCMSPSVEVSRNMQMLRESDLFEHDVPCENLVPQVADSGPQAMKDVIPSSQPQLERQDSHAIGTQFSLFDAPSPDESVGSVPLPPSLQGQFTQATEVDGTQFLPKLAQSRGVEVVEPKRSRLRKAFPSDLERAASESTTSDNVFKRMRRKMNAEQHERSRKAFVDDRAVESDDEYAGLGGASDEEVEDADEVQAELADMIDDVADNDVEGQQKIAAFYAQKDLENDEKMVNTLMNDINNGGLRRKRGAGLLDMEDSEDEEEEKARYKARQAQMRARLLEAQNLTSLADNPKTKAFIDALEDRPVSANYIEIAGEDDLIPDIIPETQTEAADAELNPAPAQLQRTDTVADDESTTQLDDSQMRPPSRLFKKPNKRRTQSDIRKELSFLRDEDDDSQDSLAFDPAFVPTLKRERSSLTIEDRSTLSRENSQTWCDPRTKPQRENSMYSQLAASRSTDSLGANAPATVVVSKGHQLASRMATKAVNYHAKAAQAMRDGRHKLQESKMKNKGGGMAKRDNKQDVLKLFA